MSAMKRCLAWILMATLVGAVGGCRTVRKDSAAADGGRRPTLRLDHPSPYARTQPQATRTGSSASSSKEAAVERLVAESIAEQQKDASKSAYRLRVGDSVIITLRAQEAEQLEMLIDENGNVMLPYIDAVQAAGLTSSELETRIQRTYVEKKIYKVITVNVFIPMRSYFVRGEVRQPGRFPITGPVTLVRAIATAGGLTDYADLKDVRLIRGDKQMKYNLKDIEANPEKDVPVETGDVIIVTRSFI